MYISPWFLTSEAPCIQQVEQLIHCVMITIQVGPIGIAIPEVVNQKSHPTEWRRLRSWWAAENKFKHHGMNPTSYNGGFALI